MGIGEDPQTRTHAYYPITPDILTKITAEAEKLAIESTQSGKITNLGELVNALMAGMELYRPDIYEAAIALLSKKTGDPLLTNDSFRELISLLNSYGVYYNELATVPPNENTANLFPGSVFVPVTQQRSLQTAKSSLLDLWFHQSELASPSQYLVVHQPQWGGAGTTGNGQIVVNHAAIERDFKPIFQGPFRSSPAFKDISTDEYLDATAANEFLHLKLAEVLKFRPSNEQGEAIPFDGPPPVTPGITAQPLTQHQVHEFLSDAASIGFSQLDLARVLFPALNRIDLNALKLGQLTVVHDPSVPGYDTTRNFAIQALFESFDRRGDRQFLSALETYSRTAEPLWLEFQKTSSDYDRHQIENQFLQVRENFVNEVFQAMQPQDREFIAQQYKIYGKTLLEYIRGSQYDL